MMHEQIQSITQLIKQLQQVPYLASKNLYKVLNHFLEMDPVRAQQFCKVLMDAKANLSKCINCGIWKESKLDCAYCQSQKRDQKIICVVETWEDFIAIEKTGGFNGVYHVLGGAISPLDGISPEDLTVEQLVKRVMSAKESASKETGFEIILAMNQTPEGEATSVYIANKLKNLNIKITCLARGIPVGYSLGNMDRVTVYKALSERRLY